MQVVWLTHVYIYCKAEFRSNQMIQQKCRFFLFSWMTLVSFGCGGASRSSCLKKTSAGCSMKRWKRLSFRRNEALCHAAAASYVKGPPPSDRLPPLDWGRNSECAPTSLSLVNTPPQSHWVAAFSRRNCNNGSQTIDYLPKLKSAGLDSDPYNLQKRQWFTDIDSWPRIRLLDIYCYLISMLGKHTKSGGKQKSGRQLTLTYSNHSPFVCRTQGSSSWMLFNKCWQKLYSSTNYDLRFDFTQKSNWLPQIHVFCSDKFASFFWSFCVSGRTQTVC